MSPQEILNQKLQIEIGKLVMEIAVLKTNAEVSESAQKAVAEASANVSGSPNGARGADGSGTE